MNLKEETLQILKEHGKGLSDINWIGSEDFKIDLENGIDFLDVSYDSGYGGQEIAHDLMVVGDGFWLEREEYDGAEGWSYKEIPTEPSATITDARVNRGMWSSLKTLNQKEND